MKKTNDELNINCLGKIDAQSIVFIHGVGSSLSNWVFHYSILLMHQYKCIAYDLRGHGKSFYPQNGYRLKDHVTDVERIYEKFPTINRKIVAHSYGGNIALQWAMLHGKENDLLFILDSPELPVPDDTIHSFLYDLQTVLNKDFSPTSSFAMKLSDSIKNNSETILRPAENYKKRLNQLSETNFEQEIVLDQPFSDEALAAIKCKVVLIYAKNDCNLNYADRMMKKIQNCELHIVDADHQLVTTHHKEIIEIIKQY